MKPSDVHSMALFWSAAGTAVGALATRYIPSLYIILIGAGIVALILAHHLHTWMKRQQSATRAFNTQNSGKRRRTSSKKRLPKMKGA